MKNNLIIFSLSLFHFLLFCLALIPSSLLFLFSFFLFLSLTLSLSSIIFLPFSFICSLQFLLSFFISHFLSFSSLIISISPVSFFYLFLQSHSLSLLPIIISILSFSLFSILVPYFFLFSLSLCAILHGRESIVGLFGLRFRRVARLPFTAIYIER